MISFQQERRSKLVKKIITRENEFQIFNVNETGFLYCANLEMKNGSGS